MLAILYCFGVGCILCLQSEIAQLRDEINDLRQRKAQMHGQTAPASGGIEEGMFVPDQLLQEQLRLNELQDRHKADIAAREARAKHVAQQAGMAGLSLPTRESETAQLDQGGAQLKAAGGQLQDALGQTVQGSMTEAQTQAFHSEDVMLNALLNDPLF
jgi:hypothetical protein